MTRKTTLTISITVVLLIATVSLIILRHTFHKPQQLKSIPKATSKPIMANKGEGIKIISKQPLVSTPDPNFTVSPTFELAKLVELFQKDIIEEAEKESDWAADILKLQEAKKSGKTMWGSEKWMKEPNYYKNLETPALAEECFSKPIFALETTIFENPRFGYERVKVFHNGFAELFSREDMWKGILHVYDYLSSKLEPNSNLRTIVEVSGNLQSLAKLYTISPSFREQVKGREVIFLAANRRVLKKYVWYIENCIPQNTDANNSLQKFRVDREKYFNSEAFLNTPSGTRTRDKILAIDSQSEKLGPDISMGFFCEPCSIARVALMLAKQIDSQKYAEIEPEITSVRWPQKQNITDVKSFLELVLKGTDGIVPQE